ncbi:TonB-dependent receptor [Carboxylicivirga sp. N1Y90]|uniref:TonB-dependent receptor n=1 Tax=Carboxylicivirga fragile TaxID=3417571 RepID=UPI003D344095|nr:TonB-dependent receptor [Marinilabiliaceae bacterium N1Y90]
MIRLFYIFLFLSFISKVAGQTVLVRDHQSLQPLELVTIFTQNPIKSTVTNMKGQSSIQEFVNLDSIHFRLIGYETIIINYADLKNRQFEVLMEQSELSLDEVVVSATKWKQGRRDTPSKISVLKPKDVSFLNPQTAADLIEKTGDVFIQKSQMGGGSPMIRGFATNRVLITVDGVRMNNAIFRSGNIQNIISLDPFATNRAEVIFGPGSIIYGSDAIGGVMGFYTFDPILSHGERNFDLIRANTRYSSANSEITGHVDFNLGFDKWASFSSITYSKYGDQKMGKNGPDDYLRSEYVERQNGVDEIIDNREPTNQIPSGYNQLNLMQKFKYAPNDRWQLNYGFHYSESSNVDRYDRLIQYKDDALRYAEWYYGPQVWLMNNLNIQHSGTSKMYDHVQILASHQFFKESRHSRSLNAIDKKHRTEKVNAYSINIDLEKGWRDGNRLFYGFETVINKVNSKGQKEDISNNTCIPDASRYPDGSIWLSMAGYGNILHKFNEKTSFQGGLRYNYIYLNADFNNDYYDFQFTNARINTGAVTGSAGLIHNPIDHWQLSATIATGFRAPNIDDVGKVFDSEPGSVVVPNPDLKPEYAINGELGAAVVVVKKLKIDFATYYTILTDAMVRRDFTLNGEEYIMYDDELSKVQAIQNAAHAYVYGIQCGFEFKLKSGISASSRFNYQKGEEELEDGTYSPMRHAPPWFGSSHISYKNEKLKLDFNLQYNGQVAYNNMPASEISKTHIYALDGNGNPYSPSWTTMNIRGQYQINDALLATAGIDNLTDKRYKGYSSGIAAPGRNFIISLMLSL